ncbi:MAG: hypothetical protein LBP53_05085 [Candidatus Peribacteria bacterium]|jgi:hypothetical protein|nr:hypothetical protein [Candidatus Peribacteria bacterium]
MSLNRLNHSTTLFPSLQITPTPILRNKDIYIDTISLTGLVEALANPEIELTDKHIINLVLKYMYAFVDIDSLHQIVDIQDIDYLFSVGEKVFHFAHQKSNFLMTSDQYNRTISELSQEYPLVEVFDKNKYGLAMLSDIPSTVSIIKNIIQQKHNPQLSH